MKRGGDLAAPPHFYNLRYLDERFLFLPWDFFRLGLFFFDGIVFGLLVSGEGGILYMVGWLMSLGKLVQIVRI